MTPLTLLLALSLVASARPSGETTTAQSESAAPSDASRPSEAQSEANRAFQRFVELRRRVLNGAPPPAGFEGVDTWLAQAKQAQEARTRELFRRTFSDQFARMGWGGAKAYAPGLSEPAQAALMARLSSEMASIDVANTAWLKAQLQEIGWFKISRYGKSADKAAWLLVQHSDQDPDFQERVLATLGGLLAEGETSRTNYAYLFDRVAIARGRPQRYGTQMTCPQPGLWRPKPVEVPEQLDARRAEVGLEPEAEYEKQGASLCR